MTTKAEREHLSRVAQLGCVICRQLGIDPEIPALCHHTNARTMGRKSDNFSVIPLCKMHHDAGIHGVSVHAGLETWEANFGTEAELLEQTLRELGV